MVVLLQPATAQEVSSIVLAAHGLTPAQHRVAALVLNEQTTDPFTERVKAAATAAGVPVVGVTETLPDGVHYAAWMARNLDHLDTALSPR